MLYDLGDLKVAIPDSCYAAPGAVIIGNVSFGDYCSIWFNAVIRGDNDAIVIGEGTNIQECSVLHVDTGYPLTLGKNVTVGHKAMLHGCSIGDGSLIGMNAVVLNGAEIGEQCLIGANALVTEGARIPARSLVLGSPAKVIKTLGPEQVAEVESLAHHYQKKIPLYKSQLKPASV